MVAAAPKRRAIPQPPIRLETEYGAVLESRMQLAHHAALAAAHAGKDPVGASRDALEWSPLPRARLRRLVAQVDGHAAHQMQRAGLPSPRRAAGSSLRADELRADQTARPAKLRLPKPPEPMRQGVSDADVERFVRENVSLIEGLQDRWYDDVSRVVLEAQKENWPKQKLEKAIAREAGVSRRRAKFIARDQVAKLNGKITQARQESVGVTEYTWSTSRDERVRPMHKNLEGSVHRWDDPPVTDRKGSRNHPGGDFQCLPGDVRLQFATNVSVAFRRRYNGELTEIVTDAGPTIRATPNHPVLTSRGWIPAHLVQVGDDVFCATQQRPNLLEGDVEHRDPTMAEVFETLAHMGTLQLAGRRDQFHGDGSDEDVDVVMIDCGLLGNGEPGLAQDVCELVLAAADTALESFVPECRHYASLIALGFPANSSVRGFGKVLSLFGRSAAHPDEHRRAARAWVDAVALKQVAHAHSLNAETLRDCLDALAALERGEHFVGREWLRIVRGAVGSIPREAPGAQVLADQVGIAVHNGSSFGQEHAARYQRLRVVKHGVVVDPLSSHVFNLSTETEWYHAGIVMHNCRCVAIPKLSLDDI